MTFELFAWFKFFMTKKIPEETNINVFTVGEKGRIFSYMLLGCSNSYSICACDFFGLTTSPALSLDVVGSPNVV